MLKIAQILTPDGFGVMEKSFYDDTQGLSDEVGISVALWRLRALMAGYRWALDNGMTGTIVEQHEAKGS